MSIGRESDKPEGSQGDDPFASHLRFLEVLSERRGSTLADRHLIGPTEFIGSRVAESLDFEALEAIASWQGLFQPPREKRADELDPEVEGQMKACMPQFHLRNIGRAERLADPDDDLELEHDRVAYGLRAPGAAHALLKPYEAPVFLEETHLERVANYQARMRWLLRETPWPRHFCQELKESIRGPLWRYDPDAKDEDV